MKAFHKTTCIYLQNLFGAIDSVTFLWFSQFVKHLSFAQKHLFYKSIMIISVFKLNWFGASMIKRKSLLSWKSSSVFDRSYSFPVLIRSNVLGLPKSFPYHLTSITLNYIAFLWTECSHKFSCFQLESIHWNLFNVEVNWFNFRSITDICLNIIGA